MPSHPSSDGKAANTLQIVTGQNSSTLKLCFMKDNFTTFTRKSSLSCLSWGFLSLTFLLLATIGCITRSHYAWDQSPKLALSTCQGSRVPKWLCHGHLLNFAIKCGESCFRIMALSLSLGPFPCQELVLSRQSMLIELAALGSEVGFLLFNHLSTEHCFQLNRLNFFALNRLNGILVNYADTVIRSDQANQKKLTNSMVNKHSLGGSGLKFSMVVPPFHPQDSTPEITVS